MLQNVRAIRARRDSDEGFTLIELMVVVLIIAILIAIAIPTFLGARNRAQDRAVQSNLRNGLTNAKAIFTDSEDYTKATPAALQLAEPSLVFQAAASADPKHVSVATPSANLVVMAAKSKSGTCYVLRDNTQGPGTQFASGSCDAAAPPADGNFQDAW